VLKPELPPSREPIDLYELRFPLNQEMDVFKSEYLIRYPIETTESRTQEFRIPMSSIPC
jgi:hypothetical protein